MQIRSTAPLTSSRRVRRPGVSSGPRDVAVTANPHVKDKGKRKTRGCALVAYPLERASCERKLNWVRRRIAESDDRRGKCLRDEEEESSEHVTPAWSQLHRFATSVVLPRAKVKVARARLNGTLDQLEPSRVQLELPRADFPKWKSGIPRRCNILNGEGIRAVWPQELFTGAHLRSYSGKRRARHGIRVTPDVYCKRQRNLMDLKVARGDPSQGHLELPNMVMARAKLKLGSSYLHLAATLATLFYSGKLRREARGWRPSVQRGRSEEDLALAPFVDNTTGERWRLLGAFGIEPSSALLSGSTRSTRLPLSFNTSAEAAPYANRKCFDLGWL
ncbi:hypothetical protein K438DRAFT_1775607 [Mycena galopus ATCC 62051]|nr:hypothetical protein K438DRAFT_1775607 [Mycena galopus ATCC 62051]